MLTPLTLNIAAIGAISILILRSLNADLAANQLTFWAVGTLILVIVSRLNHQFWPKISPLLFLGTIIALALLPFLGESIRGSARWFDIGIFRVQPSEAAKVTSILLLSVFFASRPAQKLTNLFLGFLIILIPAALTFIQPDIGNTLTFLAIFMGISYVAGANRKHLLVTAITLATGAIFIFELLAPYQKQRLLTFINPTSDPLSGGYQLIQSKIAVGSGQFFGRGLGSGSQSQLKFLPEAQSDFIFAATAEQLGLFGAGLLIILTTLMITQIVKIGENCDRLGQLICAGTASFLLFQTVINIGMNLAILPITGITLPLVSYGGSSLVSTLFLLGIVFAIRRGTKSHLRGVF